MPEETGDSSPRYGVVMVCPTVDWETAAEWFKDLL